MKHIFTVLTVLCLSAVSLHAQDFDPTIEVRKDYDASLINISKPKLETSVNDSLYHFNLEFDYTTKSRPYSDLYEFSPIQFFKIARTGEERLPVFFSDFGFSYPTNPHASIYFHPILKNGKNSLLIYGNHDSEWKKLDGIVSDLMFNDFGLAYRYAWKKGEVTLDARYSGDYKTYSGFFDLSGMDGIPLDERGFMSDNYSAYRNGASAMLNIRSSHIERNSFDYDIRLKYRFTDIRPDLQDFGYLQDNYFSVSGFVGPTFARKHKIQIGFNNETSFYGNGKTFGLLELKPSYQLDLKRWHFDLGLKISIPYNDKDNGTDHMSGKRQIFFPDVHMTFNAVNKALLIYAQITGGDRFNTISSTAEKIPWISPEYDVPCISTETLKAELGFKGSFRDRFWYNIYGDYGIENNMLTAVSNADIVSLLDPHYQNFNYAGAGLEMRYRNRFLEFGLEARYRYLHHYNEKVLLESPLKVRFFGEYTWRDRIKAGIHLGYEYGHAAALRKGETLEYRDLDGFFNLGIYLSYRISHYATVYLQGDNLTNSKQYEFLGYREKGINFGLGMYVKF